MFLRRIRAILNPPREEDDEARIEPDSLLRGDSGISTVAQSAIADLSNDAPPEITASAQPAACCPYCGCVLENPPKRKKRCLECRQYIMVRKGILVTEDEAAKQDWLSRLSRFGIASDAFDSYRSQLSREFGVKAPINDTVWHILNVLVSTSDKAGIRRDAYWEMSVLVGMEGKDPKPYLEHAAAVKLQFYKSIGIKFVRIQTYSGRAEDAACEPCGRLHGKKLTIDEALSAMPVPNLCEDESGCRCDYISEEEWRFNNDESGTISERQMKVLELKWEAGL